MNTRLISRRNGFTLVELLVALFVFSLISVAGVALLRGSADGQLALKKRLGDHSAVVRTANLLDADLAQAVTRRIRDISGNAQPVFTSGSALSGQAGPSLFAFTRTGLSAASGNGTSSVGRVSYSFDGNALTRTSWPASDGAQASPPAVLLNDLQSVTARYRAENGQWRRDWSAADTDALPRAVELTITPRARPAYRLVMLVGTQIRPPETRIEVEDAT